MRGSEFVWVQRHKRSCCSGGKQPGDTEARESPRIFGGVVRANGRAAAAAGRPTDRTLREKNDRRLRKYQLHAAVGKETSAPPACMCGSRHAGIAGPAEEVAGKREGAAGLRVSSPGDRTVRVSFTGALWKTMSGRMQERKHGE